MSRKKFKIILPEGGRYKPQKGSMVIMNGDGIFFLLSGVHDYYTSFSLLSGVIGNYTVEWND